MQLERKFIFGDGYFLFFGNVNQNEVHQNAAYHLILSSKDDVTISNNDGGIFVGKNILIKPLANHKMKCDSPVLIIYLSPKLGFSINVLSKISGGDIISLKPEDVPFDAFSCLTDVANELDKSIGLMMSELDPRLVAAIDYLSNNLHGATILDVAERCNLSRSRLRSLSREQIGMPLSKWLVWKKLVESNRALSAGASLSEAAFAGGFSDQAHFSRTMKKMFGVTPLNALELYT